MGVPRVTTDGTGVVSHAGTALLRELAERIGLRAEFAAAVDGIRRRGGGHDPGQVLVDLAVMLADGGEAIAGHRRPGRPAGPARPGRVAGDGVAGAGRRRRPRLGGLRAARAAARERAWLARAEITGRELPPARAAGRDLDYVVMDIDATLIEVHSEKEQAPPHFKGGFGYHPMLCFLDNTNEALAGILRTGQRRVEHRRRPHRGPGPGAGAAARTRPGRADPGPHRRRRVLPRLPGPPGRARRLEYSVGYAVTEDVRTAIAALPRWAWTPAVDADGGCAARSPRSRLAMPPLAVAEPSPAMLDLSRRPGRPGCGSSSAANARTPAPSSTRSRNATATATRRSPPTPAVGQLAFLEARHRAHARVEDRIRQLRTPASAGCRPGCSRSTPVWLELALTAADLLAWTQTILLADAARPGPGRVEDDPLPAAAHRRPDHPQRPADLAAAGRRLALGTRAGPRIHDPAPHPATWLSTPPPAIRHETQRRPRPPRRATSHAPSGARPAPGPPKITRDSQAP